MVFTDNNASTEAENTQRVVLDNHEATEAAFQTKNSEGATDSPKDAPEQNEEERDHLGNDEKRDQEEMTTRDGGRDEASVDMSHKNYPEVNYDVDPTELFMELQRRDWTAVLDRCLENPDQARVWVFRNEVDGGTLRWKLLPIHAAIIFDAPEEAIQALLEAYPKGAQMKDDQGMLPLHLAFRHGSTVSIVNLLLVAYPQSVKVKDNKGRIPLVLVQASNSPNRDAFIQALQRGPTFYAVAAAATERAAVTTEQRAIFDAKLVEVEKQHKEEVDKLKEENEKLEKTVRHLNSELDKSQAATQVLVKLVNSLEGQLTNMSESESFLAKKIVTLDANLKKIVEQKDRIEDGLKAQIAKLQEEKLQMQNSNLQQLNNIRPSNNAQGQGQGSTFTSARE